MSFGHAVARLTGQSNRLLTALAAPLALLLSLRGVAPGVYDEPKCSDTDLDHAVMLVGYGTHPDSGKEYWLIKVPRQRPCSVAERWRRAHALPCVQRAALQCSAFLAPAYTRHCLRVVPVRAHVSEGSACAPPRTELVEHVLGRQRLRQGRARARLRRHHRRNVCADGAPRRQCRRRRRAR